MENSVTDSGSGHDASTLLETGLERLNIALARARRDMLLDYLEELCRWNRRINLVARNASVPEIIERHFLDSLTLLLLEPELGRPGRELIDVGSGAGFPGMVLAIACPDLRVVLVEPRSKRVSFLRHVIRQLGLDNVRVAACRIEACEEFKKRKIDCMTGRAVAEPREFVRMLEPWLRQGARLLLMLGPDWRDREDAWLPDMQIEREQRIDLPFSGAGRLLLKMTRS